MNLEDKLTRFYNNCIDSANQKAAETLEQHQAVLDQLLDEHKHARRRQADAELADEKVKLQRDMNKALSAEQLKIRRVQTTRTLEIRQELFDLVQQKLSDYQKTPEYMAYLCEKISKAAAFAQDDEILFYVDASDKDLIPELSAKTGVKIEVSDRPIMGGMQALIPQKNILINNSFASALAEEKEQLTLKGGSING